MKFLLILWTTTLAPTLAQTPPDCSALVEFPWFITNPINCRAYWFCSSADAEPVFDQCPEDYNFNEEKQMCDSPDEFPCEDPTIPVRPPPRNVCEGLPNGRFVNDPTLCRAFFECINYVAFPRQCDMGLNFNEELQKCDHPTLTPCSNDDFECPFYGISRWEVPGSCNEYNYCFAGQHQVQTCDPGLLFDSNISLCAPEENVECTRVVLTV